MGKSYGYEFCYLSTAAFTDAVNSETVADTIQLINNFEICAGDTVIQPLGTATESFGCGCPPSLPYIVNLFNDTATNIRCNHTCPDDRMDLAKKVCVPDVAPIITAFTDSAADCINTTVGTFCNTFMFGTTW